MYTYIRICMYQIAASLQSVQETYRGEVRIEWPWGEASLTPRRHSLAASPVCSPGAASRRVLHTSSHSKGCRLEDRKRCTLSPPWMQKALSPALGPYSQGTGRKRRVSQATISTQSRHPLAQTHHTSQLDLATDSAPVRPLLPYGALLVPKSVYYTACLLTWYQCTNDMDLFPNWKSVFT